MLKSETFEIVTRRRFDRGVAVRAVVASAADLETRAATREAEVFSWTGFYVGGNVGAARESLSGTTNFISPNSPAALANTPQSNALRTGAAASAICTSTNSGGPRINPAEHAALYFYGFVMLSRLRSAKKPEAA